MTLAAPTIAAPFRPLRFALRELRGGLRGFCVFIACIALGVDGDRRRRLVRAQPHRRARARRPRHPRRRPVVLADPSRGERGRTRASSTAAARSRSPPPCARWRAPPTAARALVEIKAVDGAYPLLRRGRARARRCRSPTRWRSATARSAPRSIRRCWRGSISSRARASPSARRPSRSRAALKSEPDKLAGGIGFGPRVIDQRGGAARHRPAAARQPGALALPAAAAGDDASDRAAAARRRRRRRRSCRMPAGRCARRTNASPALERNVERFTQFLTLVGLTALLVGGVGVANAVKQPSRPQARRDRHAEIARRDRRPRVRDLSHRR